MAVSKRPVEIHLADGPQSSLWSVLPTPKVKRAAREPVHPTILYRGLGFPDAKRIEVDNAVDLRGQHTFGFAETEMKEGRERVRVRRPRTAASTF